MPALSIAVLLAAASAADGPWGEARVRVTTARRFVLEADGARDPGTWITSRVVVGAATSFTSTLRGELELEGLNGFVAGDATTLGTSVAAHPFPFARDGRGDLARVLPRKAFVTWTLPFGALRVGAQTFGWGTGMLANDGTADDRFGDAWAGNVVARVAFFTRPIATGSAFLRSTVVFLGGDFVLRDDNASVWDGDRALAAVVGARASHDGDALGLLCALRHQTDREDPFRPSDPRARTDVVVLDVHGRLGVELPGQRLTLEGELAAILGHTTRPWSDATVPDGATVRQLGGLGRLRWDLGTRLSVTQEGGYASGDGDPRDGVARTFTMHTDHNVGLVLFEHVLPLLSAFGADRAASPTLVGTPSPGLRFAINPGAVQNAIYTHSIVRLRPVERLDLRLGYLFAIPAADLVDAYQTGVRGGFPTSAGGVTQSRAAYGHELDARAAYDVPLPRGFVRVGAEVGVLFPGGAFAFVPGLLPTSGARPITVARALLSLHL